MSAGINPITHILITKQCMKLINLRNSLVRTIEKITGKKRYVPNIQWSSNLWTHNIFRAIELVIGREWGIRAEASAGLKTIKKNGRNVNVIVYEYYTFEALCAGTEGRIRTLLSKIRDFDIRSIHIPLKLHVYRMQPIGGVNTGIFGTPYVFAIAYDSDSGTNASTSATTTLTISYTTSGSDRLIAASAAANGPSYTTSSITYNSASLTKINERRDSAGPIQGLWYKAGPTVGTNNLVITNSGSATAGACISFTGADQTSPLDASSLTTESTTTSYSSSVTVATANCMLVATSRTGSGSTLTGGTNTSIALQPELTYFGGGAIWYSTATVGTGSQTLNVTCTSQLFGGATMASFKPVGDMVITPSVQADTLTILSPTVTSGSTITPNVQSDTLALLSSTVIYDTVNQASVQQLTLALLAVDVLIADATVYPSVQADTLALLSPTISTDTVIQPSVETGSLSLLSPTIKYDYTVAVLVEELTFTIIDPTISTAGYFSKYSGRGTSYGTKYTPRM